MSTETQLRTITCEDVRLALLTVVAYSPERVDPHTVNEVRPRYLAADGTPNSLVAAVLLELGLGAGLLRQLDAEFPLGEVIHSGVRLTESRNPALAVFEAKTIKLLDYLQDCQDHGLPWSDSYMDAFAKPSRLIPQRFVRDRRPWMF